MRLVGAFLLLILLSQQSVAGPRYFHRLDKASLPPALRESLPYCEESRKECLRRFLSVGDAWAGDLNDDGKEEIIVFPGYGGTGGQNAVLFEQRSNKWRVLLDYFSYDNRFLILPLARSGYHDLCLDDNHCFKWNKNIYVRYSARDYRKLLPANLETRSTDEATLRWMNRYAGKKSFHLAPDWYVVGKSSDLPERLGLVESKAKGVWAEQMNESTGVHWVSVYKAGVWGVQGKRAFLLLPRAEHKGAERFEIEGDWLLIYVDGVVTEAPLGQSVVARYNRTTREMQILAAKPFWLDPIDD